MRNSRGGWGLILAGVSVLIAILAPMLASEAPLVARVEGGICLPSLRAYPCLAWLAACPSDATRDWRAERIGSPKMILIDTLVPYGPESTDLDAVLKAPSAAHWLGTDTLGRDVASRLIHGFPVAVGVGGLATVLALAFGIVLGAAAGEGARWVDLLLSRFIDLMTCFPTLILALALASAADRPGLWTLVAAIAATRWTGIARYFRGEVLRQRGLSYCDAARAAGASALRLLSRHILPNALAPILVTAAFSVSNAVLLEAGMSFLGVGVPPGAASWGSILAEAQRQVQPAWWLVAFPSLALFLTVLSCNLLAEAWQESSDPRISQVG